jgi:hypothetical protein
MTNLRTLAATAAAFAVAVTLLAGAPAQASTTGFPPPPIPSPSGGSLPPGTVIRPVVQLPTCSGILMPGTLPAMRTNHPGFALTTNRAGFYGAGATPLVNIITADRSVTCTYGYGGAARLAITEVAISTADYNTLYAWYKANSSYHVQGGGPVIPGTSSDIMWWVGTFASGSTGEVATISPDGWWITVRDLGSDSLPYVQMDTVERFMELNPTRI